MKEYYLVCEVCNAKIRISKKLKEWLEEHYGNLGIIVDRYPTEPCERGFEPDTKVLRFRIEVKERYTPKEGCEALQHGQI